MSPHIIFWSFWYHRLYSLTGFAVTFHFSHCPLKMQRTVIVAYRKPLMMGSAHFSEQHRTIVCLALYFYLPHLKYA